MPQTRQTTLRKYFQKHLEPTPLMKKGGGKTFEGIQHVVGVGWTGRERPTKKYPFREFNLEFEEAGVRDAGFDDKLGNIEYELGFDCADNAQMISRVEYNEEKQAMRVYFISDGSIVVYPNIPSSIYADLKYTCESSQGHIGARFWDIIRIHYRGNFVRYGSKYNYVYETKGESSAGTKPRASEYNTQYYDPFEGKDKIGKASDLMRKARREEKANFESGLIRMTGKTEGQKEGRPPTGALKELLGEIKVPTAPPKEKAPVEHVTMTMKQYRDLVRGLGGE